MVCILILQSRGSFRDWFFQRCRNLGAGPLDSEKFWTVIIYVLCNFWAFTCCLLVEMPITCTDADDMFHTSFVTLDRCISSFRSNSCFWACFCSRCSRGPGAQSRCPLVAAYARAWWCLSIAGRSPTILLIVVVWHASILWHMVFVFTSAARQYELDDEDSSIAGFGTS